MKYIHLFCTIYTTKKKNSNASEENSLINEEMQ